MIHRSTARVCHMTLTRYCRTLLCVLLTLLLTGCQPIGFNSTAIRLNSYSQHRLPTSGPLIGSTIITPSSTVCDLGVLIDQDLPCERTTHVQRTASRCFANLRQLRLRAASDAVCRRPSFSVWLLHSTGQWPSAVWIIVTVSLMV